jgi:hypothetical protein
MHASDGLDPVASQSVDRPSLVDLNVDHGLSICLRFSQSSDKALVFVSGFGAGYSIGWKPPAEGYCRSMVAPAKLNTTWVLIV